MPVFSLSIHATYRCRHAGACCTAGWHIPVEPERQSVIGASLLTPDERGACTFYDRVTGLCRIHRDHGHEQLPVACQQFPRVSLTDDRGTFLTLSHFCPTAAALLFEPGPLAIVEGPSAFPADRIYDGLDARGEWAPSLKPGVLLDLATYDRWQRALVTILANTSGVNTALAQIAALTERLRAWTVNDGPFGQWASGILAAGCEGDTRVLPAYERFAGDTAHAAVASLVREPPEGLDRREERDHARQARGDNAFEPTREWGAWSPVVRRYLAAKAFGSWCAYQGAGLRTQVAELYATEAVLRHEAARLNAERRALDRDLLLEAIRAADLLLVHAVDRERFTAWLGQVERTA